MNKAALFSLCLLGPVVTASGAPKPAGDPKAAPKPPAKPAYTLTEQEVMDYDRVQRKLEPAKEPLLKQLKKAFPNDTQWTEFQVEALKKAGVQKEVDYLKIRRVQKGYRQDTFPTAEADRYLLAEQKKLKSTADFRAILRTKYGDDQDWYTAAQLRDVVSNGAAPMKTKLPRPWDDPIRAEEMKIPKVYTGFRMPRVRESWQDVLYDEDASQRDAEKKAIGSLHGASLSYVHNGNNGSDTWTTKGALIFPWVYQNPRLADFQLEKLAFAPSISLNKVDTSDPGKKDSDEVLYRLGAFADWHLPPNPGMNLQVRASAVYASDTHGDAEMPGYEVEIEPRIFSRHFPIGYSRVFQKEPLKADGSDYAGWQYQLRTWVRLEGGDVQRNGGLWDAVEGDFMRWGPSAQLKIDAPSLFFGRDFSLTAAYSRLYQLEGPDGHDDLFTATASWTIYKNDATGSKVNLNVDYQNGGLIFTKEDVDTLTVGLGILF